MTAGVIARGTIVTNFTRKTITRTLLTSLIHTSCATITELSEIFKRNYCFPCDHCLHGRCDGSSGLCTDGCKEHGKYNSKDPIDGEAHCVLECNTCFGMSCNFTDGTCLNGCEIGYFGEKCHSNCSTTCVNETCQQSSGDCSFFAINVFNCIGKKKP
jgi:hypothetical protein